MSEYAVDMRNITKNFGPVKANDGVNFRLKKGTIHGLLGENGAGKSTLMNILYGLYQPDEGEILINNELVRITSPSKALSCGIAMVHQHFMLANTLTVAENVMLGRKSSRGILLDTKRVVDDLKTISEWYKLDIDPNARISTLSVGEQQRVEILTALYIGAEILVLDEPTAVLTPQETEGFFASLREMRSQGKSIVLITHKLEEILSIVDEVTVLRNGKFISTCPIDSTVTKEDLCEKMIGRRVTFDFPKPDKAPGGVVLDIQNLCANNAKGAPALRGLSLQLHEGEILGLAGVDGNGQRELSEVLTGLLRATSGDVLLDGVSVVNREPSFFIGQNISHIPEDRRSTGLALNWSLKDNLIIKKLGKKPFFQHSLLQKKAVSDNWDTMQERFAIKASSGDAPAGSLSGGNQQKVIVAREVTPETRVLIANQPTRGVDIGASENVRQCILDARNNGTAVLLISADLEEIMQLSDRIAVIYDGSITGILPGGSDVLEIGKLMLGEWKEVLA